MPWVMLLPSSCPCNRSHCGPYLQRKTRNTVLAQACAGLEACNFVPLPRSRASLEQPGSCDTNLFGWACISNPTSGSPLLEEFPKSAHTCRGTSHQSVPVCLIWRKLILFLDPPIIGCQPSRISGDKVELGGIAKVWESVALRYGS